MVYVETRKKPFEESSNSRIDISITPFTLQRAQDGTIIDSPVVMDITAVDRNGMLWV